MLDNIPSYLIMGLWMLICVENKKKWKWHHYFIVVIGWLPIVIINILIV